MVIASTTIVKPTVYRMYFLPYSEHAMASPPVQSLVFLFYYHYKGTVSVKISLTLFVAKLRMQPVLNETNSVHNNIYYLRFNLILSCKLRPGVFSDFPHSHVPVALCNSPSSITRVPQPFATSSCSI